MKTKSFTQLLALLALAASFAGCNQSRSPAPGAVSTEAVTNTAPATVAPASADYAKLKGRWERPDGGYVLELRDIATDGTAKAAYFNPSPINVESARVSGSNGVTKVFVTLRDVNYPGCTYSLTYDAQADQLYGQYYQAAMQQTYDVTFGRLK